MAGQSKRTGVFFCNCDGKFNDSLDFKTIKKHIMLFSGEIVQEVPSLCKEEGQSQLSRSIQAAVLDGLVIVGCREGRLNKQCLHTAALHAIRPEKVSFVNLQDLCVNVHTPGQELNQKAARLTQQALVGQRLQEQVVVKDVSVNPTVLVVGNGLAATAITREIVTQQQVLVVGSEDTVGVEGATYYPEHEILRVAGNTGNFTITLKDRNGNKKTLQAGGIVLALENTRSIDQSLKLPDEPGILPLSQFSCDLEKEWHSKNVAFVLGDGENQSFSSTITALDQAIELCRCGAKVDFFFKQMKVAGEGLEHKYLEARRWGVRFNRYNEPLNVHVNVLGVTVNYIEPLLPGNKTERVLVDYLIAGEVEQPSSQTRGLAELLHLDLGVLGFFQPENVHLLPGKSNREGIFFIGSCHHPIHGMDLSVESKAVAASLARFAHGVMAVPQLQAVVDQERCALCLTCYRTCPHRAVEIDDVQRTAYVNSLACQRCGICAAECPAKAIELPKYFNEQVLAQLKNFGKVVAFACENSGIPAAEFAGLLNRQYPVSVELLKVPCAGKIDSLHILKALENGAQGVLLLTCHPDNCKNLRGDSRAEQRLSNIRKLLAEAGMEPSRVELVRLGANTGHKFANAVNKWLISLEPVAGKDDPYDYC